MNTGDVIQINTPEFDPDIDGGPSTKEHGKIQGSDSPIQHLSRQSKKNEAPALPQQVAEELDWPDTVPVKIPPQPTQDNNHNITASPTQHETNYSEIPPLETDIYEEEEGQFEDIQTYLDHCNTYQESQNIHKEYTKRLLDLDDERYYMDIDHIYKTYGQTRDHVPAIQTPDHAIQCKSSYKHTAEEEDKPAEKSFTGTDPLEPVHGPYRAGFKEKLKRLNA